ncbi:Acyl-CoA dehydrogenase, short-chain specific [Streptomyces sp. MBT84]|uniref:acyl-CoA dehydrogenase family protein n=1 Tax=unclassified Streptomyces TaxID=2593676 RepID=UPI001C6EB842|nr:acyl-CoA dehydrogenase family protein [Streptomyces sp. MBT84]MBW8704133.1 Acyl-CoA dehydrogenase, short-chain specific [Streptomyces sp. MBT84]
MRFLPTAEQRAFALSLDALLTAAGTPSVVRSWSAGDHAPGRALWSRIARTGVFALAVPEVYEGVGPLPVELAMAFVELGRHAVPGPVVETVLAAALLADVPDQARRLLPGLCSGRTVATVGAPYALDGDVADVVLALRGQQVWLAPGCRTGTRTSLDPARRLATPLSGGEPLTGAAPARALAWARLATAAQSLGVGLALLARTVTYVGQRVQFGVPIRAFQAVKHRLADTRIALEFARPLVFGAALTMAPADVAAAKVAAGEAAYAAARTALQLHGAIGYTAEYDLSLWLTKARALRTAWGTPAECRAVVLSGARPCR